MSELTNERLEEYARDGRNAGDCEVEQMARELLSIRTLRDAGDKEVNWCREELAKTDEELRLIKDLNENHDIAITRGQQLREARAEIENLKLERDGAVACMDSRLQQVTTLTAERDEAQGKLTAIEVAVRNLTDTLAKVEAELASLKSCPAMAEVDAVLSEWNDGSSHVGYVEAIERLADIARRSISSREEVVGLLDHILSCIITVRQENTPEWMEYIVEEVNKVNEAMGDSDRVELSRGDIVIVKGGSEIVEGNHA